MAGLSGLKKKTDELSDQDKLVENFISGADKRVKDLEVSQKKFVRCTFSLNQELSELIDLSFKEFELLNYFVLNQGVALSREKILNNVWNYDYFGDARTIDTHVKKLRSKLGEKGNYIKTVWGMGYKFEVESCQNY